MATPFRVRREVILGVRDGHLANFVWSSSCLFAVVLAWFGWMQYQETKHPRIISDINVNFEFFCPAPEPAFRVRQALVGQAPAVPVKAVQKRHEPAPVKPTSAEPQPVAKTEPQETKMVSLTKHVAEVPVAMVQPQSPATAQAVTAQTEAGHPDGHGQQATTPGTAATPVNKGDAQSLLGANFGATDLLASQASQPIKTASMGNIGPYKKDMIARIGSVWHPSQHYGNISVEVQLDKSGALMSSRVLQGCGDEQVNKSLEDALQAVQFAPLPEWYKGEQLKFKINLTES